MKKVRGGSILIVLLTLWWAGCPMSGPSDEGDAPDESETRIWYVSASAPDGGNGESWDKAFHHPQRAVNAAAYGEAVKVAEGVYGPWPGNLDNAAVEMRPGVEMYGGYHIVDGQLLGRDPETHVSELRGVSYGEDENISLQSVHIVIGASDTRLDGFSIVEGNTCLDPGAADLYGGSLDDPDYWGAGMWNNSVEKLRIHNCRFVGNQAEVGGGAVFNDDSQVDITRCQFWYNVAWRDVPVGGDPVCYGGAIAARSGTLRLENSLFVANSAGTLLDTDGWGGAISALPEASLRILHCTFASNNAEHGYALYDAAEAPGQKPAGISADASIFWNQSFDPAISQIEATADVSYSDVQLDGSAVYAGSDNINEDPEFKGGTFPGVDSFRLQLSSPCFNVVPAWLSVFDDLTGDIRNGADGWVQMGALENL